MERQTLLKVGLAFVLLFAGAVLIVTNLRGVSQTRGNAPAQAYFYDLESHQLFAASADATPPIPAPSGEGKAVRAFIYTCGSCKTDRRLVYLQMLTERAHDAASRMARLDQQERARLYDVVHQGTMVAAEPTNGSPPRWVSIATPEGRAITQTSAAMCDGKPATSCPP